MESMQDRKEDRGTMDAERAMGVRALEGTVRERNSAMGKVELERSNVWT